MRYEELHPYADGRADDMRELDPRILVDAIAMIIIGTVLFSLGAVIVGMLV
jgi:hypothetical protein